MKVEIYSDVACPWCYIGEKRFGRALAAFPGGDRVEVVFRPYQLDPGAPASAVPVAQYLERRFGRPVDGMLERVTATAAEEGITMDWDRALAVNTLTALRLMRIAEREHGPEVQRDLAERLFEAHFTRGLDVSDHDVLAELAAAAGMGAERVRAQLASGEGEAELREEIAAARERGVQAVPTFVFEGQFMVEGAQPASTFLQVLEEVKRRTAAASNGADATATGDADDGDADDGDADDGDACADGSCVVGADRP